LADNILQIAEHNNIVLGGLTLTLPMFSKGQEPTWTRSEKPASAAFARS
jgi:hypothetical protein